MRCCWISPAPTWVNTDPATRSVVDRATTGCPVLDRVLATTAETEKAEDARGRICTLSKKEAQASRALTTSSLARRGVAGFPDDSFNRPHGIRRFPVVDHVAERDIRLRLRGALFSGDIPTPRDATLTGLVGACGVPGKSSRIMTWRGSAIGSNCCAG